MSKYTTGEMARLCNISVRTVQFYDTKGVLHPSELTEGGRRLYTDDDLTMLRLICTLKALGLSLESIKGILDSASSAKVLNLLLDEQLKQLSSQIRERQTQLDAIKEIKKSISDVTTIPANSIIGIEHKMKTNKKVRKKFVKLVIIASLLTLVKIGFAVLWILTGLWIPFVVWILLEIPIGLLLAKYHFKDAAFICAECNAVFVPPMKKLMRTSGTTKARWLACTECGHAGYCVETIVEAKDEVQP